MREVAQMPRHAEALRRCALISFKRLFVSLARGFADSSKEVTWDYVTIWDRRQTGQQRPLATRVLRRE